MRWRLHRHLQRAAYIQRRCCFSNIGRMHCPHARTLLAFDGGKRLVFITLKNMTGDAAVRRWPIGERKSDDGEDGRKHQNVAHFETG